MVVNNHILGGVMKKPSSTKPSKPKGTAIIKTKGTTLPKPVKVKPVSKFGVIFVKSSYKKISLKRAPKNPLLSDYYRGAIGSRVKALALQRGQLSPKIIPDRDQCYEALGNIDCNGRNYCYICLSKLIPHSNVYKNCMKLGTITEWDISKLSDLNEDAGYYPQCEHIIACKSVSDDLNPWYMNFMMYSIHRKLLTAVNVKAEPHIPTFATTYVRPTASAKDINYLDYFLKIIIRMNYEWSHAICNNIKSNLEFAKYTSSTYQIDVPKITHVLDMLFELDKNYFYRIEVDLGNNLLTSKYPHTYDINLNKISSAPASNKVGLKTNSLKSIKDRVQFILDELTYSRTLSLGGKGFNKFNHRTIAALKNIIQGGSNADTFIQTINKKINEINSNNETKIENIETNTNININEIDINFDNIKIPTNDNDFLTFIKNIHKTIFIEMLKKEANKDIDAFKIIILPILIKNKIDILFTNLLDKFVSLISNFDIDDYFFQEVILSFNDNLKYKTNIQDFFQNLGDFINLYNTNINKNKNTYIYNENKKIENTKSYDLLIQLINYILYNPVKDAYIKKYANECKKDIEGLNPEQLKSNYLKFLTLNNPKNQSKFEEMLSSIYNRTSQETIKQHLFIIEFFKKILGDIIEKDIDIEKEFYNMCSTYLKLCINYGHIDKTELNERIDNIESIKSILEEISESPKISEDDFDKLKIIRKHLSIINEKSEERYSLVNT